ncbi:MAG: T9SS type A sorting domain-containing protein [bacterium]
MRAYWFSLLGLVAVSLCRPEPACADPVQWSCAAGGNGHFYEFVAAPSIAWNAARAAAAASSHLGIPGHLLTVTSAAEDFFVRDTFANGTATTGWIGASDAAAEGVWLWVDGPESGTQFWQGDTTGSVTPPWNYARWGAGEPNDYPPVGGEDFGALALGVYGRIQPGEWGDANNGGENAHIAGYFVEYSEPCSAVGTPESGEAREVGSPLRVFPNPGTAGAYVFSFDLPAPGPVTLAIYDVAGRRVGAALSGVLPRGAQAVRWSGLPAHGVYFARLTSAHQEWTTRFVDLGR